MEPPTVSEISIHCEVTDAQLGNPCTNEHLTAIAGFMGSWRTLAPYLGLDESDEEEIEEDGREEAEKKLKALRKWKSKFAHKATYKVLVEALVKANMADHASRVCQLVKTSSNPVSTNQSMPQPASITDSFSGGDRGAVGGEEPRTQPLATIPSAEGTETGTLDEDQLFDLSGDFAEMYCNLVPLMANAVTADKLKRYLRAYRHPKSKLPYIDPDIYEHCLSTEEILDALQVHCYIHPTHIRLLKRIVMALGCDNCKHVLQEYEAKIPMTAPVKRRRDFPTDADIDSSHSTKKMKVTVEGNPDTYSLQEVDKTATALGETTGVSPHVIIPIQNESGSVVLTFLVPSSMAEHFINISKDDIALAQSGVLKIEIDGTVIEINGQMPETHKREVESTSRKLESLSIEHIPATKPRLQLWPSVDPLKETTLPPSEEEHPLYELSDPSYVYRSTEEQLLQQLALGKVKHPLHADRRLAATGDPIHGNLTEGDERAFSLAERMRQNQTSSHEQLRSCGVTSLGAHVIADGLLANTSLKSLDLSGNAIGERGMRRLAQALHTNRTLESLELRSCGVTSIAAYSIADVLRANTSLKSLDLSGNAIGDRGVRRLAQALHTNRTLESLDISLKKATDSSVNMLATALEVNSLLKCLSIWDADGISKQGKDQLQQAAKAKDVLLKFEQTTVLQEIPSSGFAGSGTASVVLTSAGTRRQRRRYGRTRFQPTRAMSSVAGSAHTEAVKDISIGRTGHTEKSQQPAHGKGKILSLESRHTAATGDPIHGSVTEEAVSKAQHTHQDRKHHEQDVMASATRTESKHTAATGHPIHGSLTEEDERALSLAELIHQNKTKSHENLWMCKVTPKGAKAIADGLRTNTSLKSLDLRGNAIGDDGVEHLAQALRTNRTLDSLDLGNCSVTAQGAKLITDGLSANTSLKSLNLSGNTIGDDGVAHLALALRMNVTLKSLDVGGEEIPLEGATSPMAGLQSNTSLKVLCLWNCSVTSQGAKMVADGLRINTSLKMLDLSDNAIEDDGVEHLAQTLRINRTLESLNLGRCKVTSKGAKDIADGLGTNTSLKSLNLRHNTIGDDGVQHFAQALCVNNTLEYLRLQECGVTSLGAVALADGLRDNTSLKFLHLSDNAIGDDGVEVLAKSLGINRTLESLHLSQNNISSKGAASLVVGLPPNTSLKALWLYGCRSIDRDVEKELKGMAESKGIDLRF